MNPFKIFFATLKTSKAKKPMDIKSFYDININSLSGDPINLKAFKGKHILIVNVASKCGFTPQYKKLQELYETYQETLQIIGVPCNQFGSQEPGNADAIASFCELNYGVSFLMTEKVAVKGKNQHPLYEWLTDKSINGVKDSKVRWNFQKYLIDGQGNLIDYFYSDTSPMSKKIIKHLK
ncbi:MAG: glutathione peroxidase [Aquaticitalea sp.]